MCVMVHSATLPIMITDGLKFLAPLNRADSSFSPSPCHFDLKMSAEAWKQVTLWCTSLIIAFVRKLFPVPKHEEHKSIRLYSHI